MKKIIYILALSALILTGCGKSEGMITEEIGEATKARQTTENITAKPKRQELKNTSVASATDTAVSEIANPETTSMTAITGTADTSTLQSADISEQSAESDIPGASENSGTTPESTTVTTTQAVATEISIEKATDVYYLDGIVYDVTDKYIVINETNFKRMQVSVSDSSILAGINAGDTVEITYNGLINEGHVKYAYDAYSIEVTKKADKKYQLEKFEYNGIGFSVLVPEGWSNKKIEYPQDNDLTDWGIRFTPEGAVGSMDITWHSSITINGSYDKETVSVNDISARKYSRQGVWRFFVFENNYVATNNFFETSQHGDYADDMDIMLNSIEFL